MIEQYLKINYVYQMNNNHFGVTEQYIDNKHE
jgi:hypothetical protein